MSLPPMTLNDAVDLYTKARGVGPEALVLLTTGDERGMLQFALRAVVLLGDQLVASEERVIELADANRELVELIQQCTPPDLKPTPGPVEVRWEGAPRNYFDNMEAINREISEEFSRATQESQS